MKNVDHLLYEFDTLGYCRIKNFIDSKQLGELDRLFDNLKDQRGSLDDTDVCLGKQREDGTLFISNIADASQLSIDLAFDERVLRILSIFMQNSFKLNHSNAIISSSGSTYPHMAGLPIHNKAFYHQRGSSILSSLTKLVIPLANNEYDDGGFAAIPGSHKANFEIPYEKRSKEEYNLLQHIPIKLCDAILFTEAMTHGSLVNISGKCRKMLFYCYSMPYIPNWSTQELKITKNFYSKLNTYQQGFVEISPMQ